MTWRVNFVHSKDAQKQLAGFHMPQHAFVYFVLRARAFRAFVLQHSYRLGNQ